MVDLRPYQKHLLHRAEIGLATPKSRVMVQLPTGGGKTRIAATLLAGWTRSDGKAAWLTHRRELSAQTCRVLNDSGVTATNTPAWKDDDPAPAIKGGVVILMAQTVSHRNRYEGVWEEYGPNDLLVIDEAHHAAADGWARAIRQWPGQVVGLTATPWRLSETEGFNHLFGELYCGPQVSQLQAGDYLCYARVLTSQPEDTIRGGAITATGDYNESGIERANSDHPDVMTAGALHFWQNHAAERQTIIYAVSADHAHNLTAVFNDAGVPTAVMVSETPTEERARRIRQFSDGTLRVLINVSVATEGFDLPDASCVVLTRPTMSLALYLQMVGRGLRPKTNGGDCLILDLAGNSERHGLPNDERPWSLEPRGRREEGRSAPVVRCPECEGVSPAASHDCQSCGAPFGQNCNRCGVWRAWQRWSLEKYCGDDHNLVCNLCHYDAHKLAVLPVEVRLRDELLRESERDKELRLDGLKYDKVRFLLSPYRNSQLRDLLGEERSFVHDMDQSNLEELRHSIRDKESALSDDDKPFDAYLNSLPPGEAPRSYRETFRVYSEWESQQKADLVRWQRQLTASENEPIDKHFVLFCARSRVMGDFQDISMWFPSGWTCLQQRGPAGSRSRGRLTISAAFDPDPRWNESPDFLDHVLMETLLLESHSAGLWPDDGWVAVDWLHAWKEICDRKSIGLAPKAFRDDTGKVSHTASWRSLLTEVAEWLIRQGYLAQTDGKFESFNGRTLVNGRPDQLSDGPFRAPRKLSNGLYLETAFGATDLTRYCFEMINYFGSIPSDLHVRVQYS